MKVSLSGHGARGRRSTIPALAICAVFALAFLAACSSSATPILSKGGGAVDFQSVQGTSAPAPSAAASASQAEAAAPDANGGGANGPLTALAFQNDAAIVKTGTLSVEVDELDPALVQARAAIIGLGGYVSASDEARQTDHPVAAVTYRIPADRWDDAMDKLRGLGKPLAENTSAVDVTGQLVDLQARITNLRATEAALQAIMSKATKISDVLDVQSQLTTVRGQIEELAGEQAHLKDQASYGTLTVTWSVKALAAVAVTSENWNPSKEIDNAVASLVGALQGLATLGIWFAIVGLPLLAALGILLGVIVFVLRRLGAGRPLSSMSGPAGPA